MKITAEGLRELACKMDALPGHEAMTGDIRIAARFLRASSWPGEMAEEMEQRSRRLDAFADVLNGWRLSK